MTREELGRWLFDAADILRGAVRPEGYGRYILPLLFFKRLSYLYESFDNTWNDEPPSNGNYWSDHNPPDEDKDKIGDTPYIINENNVDRYPLIYPYGFVPSPDVNGDDLVNIKDLFQVSRAFGSRPGDVRWNPYADIEGDGMINIIDLYQVARDFGKTV
ncbi:MAG: type I restriction-modification system subunit M N-terminal domain-containing protein [Candidatus Bathyarchaeota archaeon]|nr:type I restriction-modification system subunit M N-terminal domain-containing protein [Candidatus Bathyarchaeota archaeon]